MSEVQAMGRVPDRFGFMVKKIAITKSLLLQWFKVPEFVHGLEILDDQHVEIDNAVVLDLMKAVYEEKKKNSDRSVEQSFNFRSCKHAINQLERTIQH